MKKWIPIAAVVAIIVLWAIFANNSLVSMEEDMNGQWANVESTYQRRADLIPNIVSTAKGYAEFEKETLTAVIEARSKATAVTIDPTNITPDQLAQFEKVQGSLNSALTRLLAVFERYPELKANENFKELINELERTENRINVERIKFNDAVKPYNSKIRSFPTSIAASVLGFEKRAYFDANDGAEVAPVVDFSK
jgi:LemA protein